MEFRRVLFGLHGASLGGGEEGTRELGTPPPAGELAGGAGGLRGGRLQQGRCGEDHSLVPLRLFSPRAAQVMTLPPCLRPAAAGSPREHRAGTRRRSPLKVERPNEALARRVTVAVTIPMKNGSQSSEALSQPSRSNSLIHARRFDGITRPYGHADVA